jgi:hypothetical protein
MEKTEECRSACVSGYVRNVDQSTKISLDMYRHVDVV